MQDLKPFVQTWIRSLFANLFQNKLLSLPGNLFFLNSSAHPTTYINPSNEHQTPIVIKDDRSKIQNEEVIKDALAVYMFNFSCCSQPRRIWSSRSFARFADRVLVALQRNRGCRFLNNKTRGLRMLSMVIGFNDITLLRQ